MQGTWHRPCNCCWKAGTTLFACTPWPPGRGAGQAFARQYGAEKAYGSYEEMLRDPAVDLVYIATPHSHHYQHIKLCANYRKHILCEKAIYRQRPAAEDAIRHARPGQCW